MTPPPSIQVEKVFGEFIKSFGGELVADVVGPSPSFENADYIFRKEKIVAELKCLTKDVLTAKNFDLKMKSFIEDWIHRGLVRPFFGTLKIQTKNLPMECQRELFRGLEKPIHTAIKKANRQIKATKAHFSEKNSKGLVFIVNDGCWSLESEIVLYLLDKVLGRSFTGINSVVYFTINMPARFPGVDADALIWVPAERVGYDAVPEDFLGKLREAWIAHYQKYINQDVPVISIEDPKQIGDLKFIRRQQS